MAGPRSTFTPEGCAISTSAQTHRPARRARGGADQVVLVLRLKNTPTSPNWKLASTTPLWSLRSAAPPPGWWRSWCSPARPWGCRPRRSCRGPRRADRPVARAVGPTIICDVTAARAGGSSAQAADGVDQLIGRGRLGQKVARTGEHGPAQVVRVALHRHDDDLARSAPSRE